MLISCGSTIENQDDCLAINKGSNIVFQSNTCSGSHGISIGSITSNVVVSNIYVANNNILNKYVFRSLNSSRAPGSGSDS